MIFRNEFPVVFPDDIVTVASLAAKDFIRIGGLPGGAGMFFTTLIPPG
jgi:hypothetical protein